MTPPYTYLAFFALGFVLCFAVTPLVRKLALATGRVAVPKENRWHRKETALLGGVGIYAAVMVTWLAGGLWVQGPRVGPGLGIMMLCASGIFVLGLLDDLLGMDPLQKLAGQIVIASILVFFGFRLGWTPSKTINLCLSILWIVGITNAFNLLDNMDGLSAGVAAIAGTFLFLHLSLAGGGPANEPVLRFLCAYVGALTGFLIYNFNPASIFMGDAGSLFIGFVLAALTAKGGPPHPAAPGTWLPWITIPILILFIPILDTGFVSLMRKLFQRPIAEGGRDHSSHRMVAIGFSERKAVGVLYTFASVSGLIALGLNRLPLGTALVVMVLYLLLVLFFWIYLGRVRVYPEEIPAESRGRGRVAAVLRWFGNRRGFLEMVLDLVLVTVAYYTAYLLRFEGEPGLNFDFFLKSLPIVIACQILCFHFLGVYRGIWESISLRDLIVFIKGVTLGTVLPILILLFLYRFISFSRAVFVIYWGLMLILASLSRLSFRLLDESIRRSNQAGRPALIYGAGIGGQVLLKEIENDRELGLRLVGFIDDDTRKHGRKIGGYPILGGSADLPELLRKHGIDAVIVSFRRQGAEKKEAIKTLCRENGLDVEVRQMRLIIA